MLTRIRKSMDENEEGFTLIELLVVIIIIGILAAIAIPVFLNQRKKGWDAAVKSDLRNAATAQETYLTDNGVYAILVSDLQAAGFKGSPDGNYNTNFATDFLAPKNWNTATPAVLGATQAAGGYCMTGKSKSGQIWKYDSTTGGLTAAAAVC